MIAKHSELCQVKIQQKLLRLISKRIYLHSVNFGELAQLARASRYQSGRSPTDIIEINGELAQLARALAWHARGHRFDSGILHKKARNQYNCGLFNFIRTTILPKLLPFLPTSLLLNL